MSNWTIEELTTPLTVDEVRQSIYSVLAALGVKTTGWLVGSVVRAIITACAVVVAAFSTLTASVAKAGFLSLSDGEWLAQAAKYQYGTEKILASFATTTVTLTNTSGGQYDLDPDELVCLKSATGKAYRNTASVVIPAVGSVSGVTVRAVEAGTGSNANAGEIDALETELLGVTVTNPTAAIATDDETDAALKARAGMQADSLSPNGPADAYAYVSLSAKRDDGTAVGITRVATSRDSTTGQVTVTLANASGAVPNDDVEVVDELLATTVAPLGITLTTQSAATYTLTFAYEVWAYRGTGTEAELTAAIDAQLVALVASVPIGGFVKNGELQGYLTLEAIRGAILRARPVGELWDLTITLSADVALSTSQVVVLGTVTPTTVHWVQR